MSQLPVARAAHRHVRCRTMALRCFALAEPLGLALSADPATPAMEDGVRRPASTRALIMILALLLGTGLDADLSRGGDLADSTHSGPPRAQSRRASSSVLDVTDVTEPDSWWDHPNDVDRNHNCIPDYLEEAPCRAFARRPIRTAHVDLLSSPEPKVYAYPPRGVCSNHLVAIIRPCSGFLGVTVTLRDERGGSVDTLRLEELCPRTVVTRRLDLYDPPAQYLLTITVGRREYSRVVTLGDNGED
jgi:hypothetical protein